MDVVDEDAGIEDEEAVPLRHGYSQELASARISAVETSRISAARLSVIWSLSSARAEHLGRIPPSVIRG